MKRLVLVTVILLAGSGLSAAQKVASSVDVLGAHLNYGRGCTACHSPHSGAMGSGSARSGQQEAGTPMLWGEDVTSLYGKTIITGGGKFVEVLPTSMSATTPDVAGMLTCLSCHDGNYASSAMMKNRVYEQLPPSYGSANAVPTLLGGDGTKTGNYLNDHPAGLSASINCGGSEWDCSISNSGALKMSGSHSSQFVNNYGFFMKPGIYNNRPVVVCTTCHDQHVMNVVTVNSKSNSGLPAGTYATMFFLRAPYNPASTNLSSNQTAQFCRQCHASQSNEMNGSVTGTVF